jgi:hypothetical protein
MIRVLAALGCLAMAGCVPMTRYENPITGEAGATLDTALVGQWMLANEEGTAEFSIEPEGAVGRVMITMREPGKKDEVMDFTLVTAHIGSLDFASVQTHGQPDPSWSYYRYQLVGDDVLRVYADRDGAWTRAANDRMLSSTAREGSQGVTITASEKELREFVQGYGAVIFEDAEQFELRRK